MTKCLSRDRSFEDFDLETRIIKNNNYNQDCKLDKTQKNKHVVKIKHDHPFPISVTIYSENKTKKIEFFHNNNTNWFWKRDKKNALVLGDEDHDSVIEDLAELKSTSPFQDELIKVKISYRPHFTGIGYRDLTSLEIRIDSD